MSDAQFPPESPQDPENTYSIDPDGGMSDLQDAQSPAEWTVDPDDPELALPVGGQYPDDMFGIDDAADAPVALPDSAISGGLADVAYGNPGELPAPLPPPAEPQVMPDMGVAPDPLPIDTGDRFSVSEFAEADEPIAEQTGGDMFSVDELIGPDESDIDDLTLPGPNQAGPIEQSAGDMFSVGDLIDDDPSAASQPTPLDLPAPGPADAGDMFTLDANDEAGAPAIDAIPSPSPEPLAMPEPFAAPEPLATPQPPVMPEPLATPEPLGTTEPLAAPEPLATPQQFLAPESLVSPEPQAAHETLVTDAAVTEPSTQSEQPVFDPAGAPVPDVAAPTGPSAGSDLLGPHGIIDSQAAAPTTDFGFAGMDPADVEAAQQPAAEPPAMPDQLGENQPPEAEPAVINPYAQEADEANVVDPAAAFGDGFVQSVPEEPDSGRPQQIVNPYAEVPDEAAVLDPAMSLSDSAPAVDESVPEVFVRSEFDQPVAGTPGVDSFAVEAMAADPSMPDPDLYSAAPPLGPGAQFDPMTGGYGATSPYDEMPPAPLPQTSRTESVAPPGMESHAAGELVVAGSSAKVKRSRGRRKKSASGVTAPVAAVIPAATVPAATAPAPTGESVAAAFNASPVPVAHESGMVSQQPFAPLSDAPAGPVAPPTGAPAPAKQGKSFADMLLGQAKPGEQRKLFGIKIGKPGAAPGHPAIAVPMPAASPEAASTAVQATPATAAEMPPAVESKRAKKQKQPKAAKPPKPAKAPKDGKSFADMLL
ncbi:MAG: hypothetical protein WBK99_00790, partial [Solirubrobacterales bacterium]